MRGVSIWQLLVIALIVLLLFGTNKLRNLYSRDWCRFSFYDAS